MSEAADIATAQDRPSGSIPASRTDAGAPHNGPLPLERVPGAPWRKLAERAIEPNGYQLADWQFAINASARGGTDLSALTSYSGTAASEFANLTGLVPVISMWRAYGIPLPALVNADPFHSLGTPLLDRTDAVDAAHALLRQARGAGAHAVVLRQITLDGTAMAAFTKALARDRLHPRVLQWHERACLDATLDPDQLLRDALGSKKLKELRRQRHRLADHGEVTFEVARPAGDVSGALETSLALEACGWKGRRGAPLAGHAGDLRFIRTAAPSLAASGNCQIVALRAGETPVAGGIVLRHHDRAFFFKIGVDEAFAKHSPGVQLTLELTRHLCADPTIAMADSTAGAGHSMIEPIWRGRLKIGDVLLPLRRNDPVVPMIHAALIARTGIRQRALGALRIARELRSKFA